jgi:hypothetical protein
MRHLDPDLLALLALGEHVAEPRDSAHLAECEVCSQELANLSHAVHVGRASLDAGELLEPHARVWEKVRDELDLQPTATATATATATVPVLRQRARRSRPQWAIPLAIAASLVIVGGGGIALTQTLAPKPTTQLASAQLGPFPDWPGASGTAVVEKSTDGARQVHVTLKESDSTPGYREVWLMTSDLKSLVSLGAVRDGSGTFTIPDGIDLARYDVVDISDEPYDGNPAHSGNSIVRGQLLT